MIRREAHKSTKKVKVTFTIPIDGVEGSVAVVGDFNDWDPTATPMTRRGAHMRASAVMPGGQRYAFRYLGEGERWFNDEAADDYQRNAFGGSDSVLDLTDGP